jgi:hypothetical protein
MNKDTLEKMDTLLSNLKSFRADAEFYKAEKAKILGAVKSSDNYVLAETKQSESETYATGVESEIKRIALEDYAENKNKHPHDKVDIAIRKKFSIIDSARVLAWVKTNLAAALIFDEKKVKDYVTKIGAVDGTELTEEPNAQIAANLE